MQSTEHNKMVWVSGPVLLQTGRAHRYKFMIKKEWCTSNGDLRVHDKTWNNEEHMLVISGKGEKEGGKVVVVLGKCLKPNGDPLPELVVRSQMAVDYFAKIRTSEADFVIFSGGQAEKATPFTEASVMKRLALSHLASRPAPSPGLQEQRVDGAVSASSSSSSEGGSALGPVNGTHLIEEDFSLTTVENAIRTGEMLFSRKGVKEVHVVTGHYHMARSIETFQRVFEKMYFKAGLPLPSLVPFEIPDEVSGLSPDEIIFNNANEQRIIVHVPRLVSEFNRILN